jgi:D-glycero-alpha-D-manno-heptose-7-phosphate kinase
MVIAHAPLRISFAGGGTDIDAYYLNYGGLVVSSAITRYCSAAVRPSSDGGIRITSADYQLSERFAPGVWPEVAQPLALPKAAIEWFIKRGLLHDGIDLSLRSDVPPGTGLGSSSAMAVALVRALAAYCALEMTTEQVAELACELEISRLSMPIGKQDQYASAFGGLNSIVFEPGVVRVQPLGLSDETLRNLNRRLLLFATGRQHNSTEILRGQRADTGRKKPVVEQALHQIKAIASDVQQALLAGELDDVGRLLDQGWQQKKQLSTAISSSAIDRWYALAREQGALGGKIVGAGGGGFLLLACVPERREAVRRVLRRHGLRELRFALEPDGARTVDEREADDEARLAIVNARGRDVHDATYH